MKPAIPFPQNQNVPVVGQPFQLLTIGIPVTATLTCNCGGPDTAVTIANSVGSACPSCGRTFNAVFNPTNGQVQFQIGVPPTPQVAS